MKILRAQSACFDALHDAPLLPKNCQEHTNLHSVSVLCARVAECANSVLEKSLRLEVESRTITSMPIPTSELKVGDVLYDVPRRS